MCFSQHSDDDSGVEAINFIAVFRDSYDALNGINRPRGKTFNSHLSFKRRTL